MKRIACLGLTIAALLLGGWAFDWKAEASSSVGTLTPAPLVAVNEDGFDPYMDDSGDNSTNRWVCYLDAYSYVHCYLA